MKKNIFLPIMQGMAVTAAFLATEIVLNLLGAFNGDIQFYLVEIPLRLIFGTVALMLLVCNFKKQKSQDSLKKLFTNTIPKCTYVLLLPFTLCLILTLLPMISGEAKEISTSFVGTYILNCGQKFATVYLEEATRALLMCGLLKNYIGTKKNRIQTIVIAGICFGLSHTLNFFFGQDIVATLHQVFHAFTWGLFAAAIYMLSKNLTLLMIMHAAWNIVINVPNTFCNITDSNVLMDVVQIMPVILVYGIMPIVAVYICINFEKLRGNQLVTNLFTSNFAKEYDCMKRLNEILNSIIVAVMGTYVLRTLYFIWNFKTYPKFYAMQSAPWYTSLLADGAITLVVLLICIVIKVIIKKKCKNTK